MWSRKMKGQEKKEWYMQVNSAPGKEWSEKNKIGFKIKGGKWEKE